MFRKPMDRRKSKEPPKGPPPREFTFSLDNDKSFLSKTMDEAKTTFHEKKEAEAAPGTRALYAKEPELKFLPAVVQRSAGGMNIQSADDYGAVDIGDTWTGSDEQIENFPKWINSLCETSNQLAIECSSRHRAFQLKSNEEGNEDMWKAGTQNLLWLGMIADAITTQAYVLAKVQYMLERCINSEGKNMDSLSRPKPIDLQWVKNAPEDEQFAMAMRMLMITGSRIVSSVDEIKHIVFKRDKNRPQNNEKNLAKFVSGFKTLVKDDYKIPVIEEASPAPVKLGGGLSTKKDKGALGDLKDMMGKRKKEDDGKKKVGGVLGAPPPVEKKKAEIPLKEDFIGTMNQLLKIDAHCSGISGQLSQLQRSLDFKADVRVSLAGAIKALIFAARMKKTLAGKKGGLMGKFGKKQE